MIMWYQLTSSLPPTTQLQYCIWAKSFKKVHEIGQLGGDDVIIVIIIIIITREESEALAAGSVRAWHHPARQSSAKATGGEFPY